MQVEAAGGVIYGEDSWEQCKWKRVEERGGRWSMADLSHQFVCLSSQSAAVGLDSLPEKQH